MLIQLFFFFFCHYFKISVRNNTYKVYFWQVTEAVIYKKYPILEALPCEKLYRPCTVSRVCLTEDVSRKLVHWIDFLFCFVLTRVLAMTV